MQDPRLRVLVEIIIYTRHWIHYGTLLFVGVVTLAAAAEGLLQGL